MPFARLAVVRTASAVAVVAVLACMVLSLGLWGPGRAPPPTHPVYAKTVEAYTRFAADLALRLGLGRGNEVVSPLSIYTALLMLVEGSAGGTREELMGALGVGSLEEAREWFSRVLDLVASIERPSKGVVANSAWIRRGLPVSLRYADTLRTYYLAEVRYLDFPRNPLGSCGGDKRVGQGEDRGAHRQRPGARSDR